MTKLSRRLLAEAVGTALLIVFGCGSVMVNQLHEGVLGLTGVAITWAMMITVLIYTFGNISGTQINPAVTLALWSVGKMPTKEVAPHIIAQLIGATLGSALLLWSLGHVGTLGATTTALTIDRAFVLEFLQSFLLMAVIMGAGVDERTPRGFAALGIGLAVGACVLVGGSLTGASMNPARSFGPALVGGTWDNHWLYWLAPVTGMISAAQLMARIGRTDG